MEGLFEQPPYCKVCTKGSGTAKSGTDEQKHDMRFSYPGKQARPC